MQEICDYMAQQNLGHCCLTTYHFKDQNRAVKLNPVRKEEAKFIQIDGKLITGSKSRKCDCLVLYNKGNSKMYAIYVELKGGSAPGSLGVALNQLSVTIKNETVNQILEVQTGRTVFKKAFILAGKGMTQNKVEAAKFEKENNVRLQIEHVSIDDRAFDLRKLHIL